MTKFYAISIWNAIGVQFNNSTLTGYDTAEEAKAKAIGDQERYKDQTFEKVIESDLDINAFTKAVKQGKFA